MTNFVENTPSFVQRRSSIVQVTTVVDGGLLNDDASDKNQVLSAPNENDGLPQGTLDADTDLTIVP